ncbi:MAG TPA: hypothetical protein VL443_05505 [Cyclobacteriaceae bacterium]|jgi:hypothetical protein|nr:hypothetical protein [Cyclobacteriaceae bacterium]
MIVDLSFSSLPLRDAVTKIVERHRDDLAPCLIIRGDDPEAIAELSQYLISLPNTFLIRLGESSRLSTFDFDLYSQLDPNFKAADFRYNSPHTMLLTKICRKLHKMSGNPIIVLDRCHHLKSRILFRFLHLVNRLEGRVLFLFLLPDYYVDKWSADKDTILKYFLKIIDKKYLIHDR